MPSIDLGGIFFVLKNHYAKYQLFYSILVTLRISLTTMKKLYCLSFFLLLSFYLRASNIDSLLQELEVVQNNPSKVQLLKAIGESYKLQGNFTNGLKYLNRAESLNSDPALQLDIWYQIASSKAQLQAYKPALKKCEDILEMANENQELIAKTYSLMSSIKLSLGETNEAYELQYESLQISETINDKTGLFFSTYQIGNIHFYQGNYKLALKYYKKSLKYAKEEMNERHRYSSLGAIGSTYHRMKDLKKSADYNLKSLQLATEIDYKVGVAYAAFNVGSDYFAMGALDTAVIFFLQALKLQEELQDKWGQSSSLRMLGEAYRGLKDWNNSIIYAEEALAIAKDIEAKPRIMESYETLAHVYEGKGDFKKANQYMYNYMELKDSLVNEETLEKIEAVQTNYEVAQKEKELFKKSNELNRIYAYILIVGIVFLLLISWMTYSRYRSEQKNNALLAEKNKQIHQQNQQLRDNNQKIQRQNIKLEQSNQELRRFAFIASHDLKEPLRTIGSFSSLLKRRYKDKIDEEANEFLDFITNGVSRMYTLLNDVLDYSKIDELSLDREAINLQETVEHVIISLGQQIEEKNGTIIIEMLPTINARQTHFTQLFQNLITNGLKYNKSTTPIINISCSENAHHYLFSVKDNGIGLDMIYKDKIFDMFQRLHGKEEYQGTGIGLAICKKIVHQYDGEIWVESELGKGTTFFFSLKK